MSYFENKNISNSDLSLLRYSPALFNAKQVGHYTNTESDSMKIGSAVHCRLLEPEKFDELYCIIEGKFDRRTTGGKIAWSNALDGCIGKAILNTEEYQTILSCETSVKKYIKDFNISALIPGSMRELEVYWEYGNVKCKSKIDELMPDIPVIINDVKTTSKSVDKFDESFDYFGYHRQMAFYKLSVEWYFKNVLFKDVPRITVQMIVVETQYPFSTRVFEVTESMLIKGFDEIQELLYDLRWHQEHDKWEYKRTVYENNGIFYLRTKDGD